MPVLYETKWFRTLCSVVMSVLLWLLYTIQWRNIDAASRTQIEALGRADLLISAVGQQLRGDTGTVPDRSRKWF